MTSQVKQGSKDIQISGARENNLKDVSLSIPKGQLTVFTGVSGSGKSSVVFDTIAVESQRQLAETFSWYIRNRLPKYERPKAETMENLATAIVVDQRPIGGNARSTVGTMTEIHAVLRVLFSRHGTPSAGPTNLYSFNDPQGMCDECEGLGRTVKLDLGKLLDESRSLNDGAIRSALFAEGTFQWQLYAQSGLFDPDQPVRDFSQEDRELFLHGKGFKVDRSGRNHRQTNEYEGLVTRFNRRYLKKGLDVLKEKERALVEEVATSGPCRKCHGGRLNQAALKTKIDGKNIADYCAMEVGELIPVLEKIKDPIADPVVATALAGLRRIDAIGLGYLSLDRETRTVSGGEGQRLKTVRHLGSSLTDVIYIFDEPSVGLHPRDVHRLNELLCELRDKGNTVLVVEHDRDVIEIADHIVDMGPGAGTEGGTVVFEGTVAGLRRSGTLTGKRLRSVPGLKEEFRAGEGHLTIKHAGLHNLKDVTVEVPLNVLTVVSGVAGSGKSTLITKVMARQFAERAVVIDQGAIGTSTRATPATYLDIMDTVRGLFAKANDVEAGLFSFNSKGGCEHCGGRGEVTTDLAYMEPVTTVCEVCHGRRYKDEVLEYTYGGKNIVDVLALTVREAVEFFDDATVVGALTTLDEVGLGYVTLGQPLSTLSGGERQRMKLASRLGGSGTVYIFDEPTTGLHMEDIEGLLELLDRLVEEGNTVVVVEHDLDVIKRADWVIDMGPEAGRHGGEVIFQGTPAQLATDKSSYTGRFLKQDLAAR